MKTFELTDEQEEKLKGWRDEHDCSVRREGDQEIYRLPVTVTFKETELTMEAGARCDCGAVVDLTEWEKA